MKAKIRARVEPVFAEQKDRMGLFIRTIKKARAQAMMTRANIAYTMKRGGCLISVSAGNEAKLPQNTPGRSPFLIPG